ncbi:hypothetical protein PACTADRAFT_50895, partial [Pachysolen tannophilus NRRL Y-2460]
MPPNRNNKWHNRNGAGAGSAGAVDISASVGGGKSKLKKKIRDIERLLKKDNLRSDVRVNNERALKTLKADLTNTELNLKAQKISKKYHMVRFFERKKAIRKLKQAQKNLEILENTDKSAKKDIKKARKILRHCEIDLAYVINFPKTEKYISLYPNDPNIDNKDNLDANVKKGLLETERKREIYKRDFEKLMDEGRLPIRIEDVLQGKKI